MLKGVRGCGRGLRIQVRAGHTFSNHVALNCNVSTFFMVQIVEMHRNRHISSIPRVT